MSEVIPNFASLDARVRYGTIQYRTERKGLGGEWSESRKLSFRSDRSYRDEVLTTSRRNDVDLFGKSFEFCSKGTSSAMVYTSHKAGKVAAIGPGGPVKDSKDALRDIMPYPCRALGFGFSELSKEAKVQGDLVQFELSSGDSLDFKPRKENSSQPTEVILYLKGAKFLKYTYSNFKSFKPGVELPTSILISPVGEFEGRIYVKYTIEKADFSKEPSPQEVETAWYNPSVAKLTDYRLSPEVDWTYEELSRLNKSSKTLTLEDLYELSKQRANVDNIYYQKMRSQIEKDKDSSLPLPSLALGGFAVIGLGFWIYKLRPKT